MPFSGHSNAVPVTPMPCLGHSNAVPRSLQCRASVTPMPCLGASDADSQLDGFGDVNLVRLVNVPSGDRAGFLDRFQGFFEIIPEAF
jgi:hypothetical protein